MKKIKMFFILILNLFTIFAPGVALGWCAWQHTSPLWAILAALGGEMVWLAVLAFLAVIKRVLREMRKETSDSSQEATDYDKKTEDSYTSIM